MGRTRMSIAEELGVHKSTIGREIERNSDRRDGKYKPEQAQRKTDQRKKGKAHFRRFTEAQKQLVESLLREEEWSPEEITGRCRKDGMEMVSHESIYQYVYADKRAGGDLYMHLRHKGRKYQNRGSKYNSRGIIVNRIDIDERPAVVDEKRRFGDLEIDTVIGKGHQGAILTINDRVTGLLWIRKLEGKSAIPLTERTIEALTPFANLIHTITADNGKEFANHASIAEQLKINFYFCKPYHSWERGANENNNGLIRQYIPKKTDFSEVEDDFVLSVQNKLNNRPRKRLGWLTPIEMFNKITNMDYVALAT